MTEVIPADYEHSEVSAAKDIVVDVLERFFDAEDRELIGPSHAIVETLLLEGVTFPEGLVSPFGVFK